MVNQRVTALAEKMGSPLLAAAYMYPPSARQESSVGRDGGQVPCAKHVQNVCDVHPPPHRMHCLTFFKDENVLVGFFSDERIVSCSYPHFNCFSTVCEDQTPNNCTVDS